MAFHIQTNDGKSFNVDFPANQLSQKDKMISAGLTWMAFLAAAALSILIPVMHFVLVPLFLGLSFYFAYSALQNTLQIGETKVMCPACSKPIEVKAKKTKDSFRLNCSSCRTQIFIKPC